MKASKIAKLLHYVSPLFVAADVWGFSNLPDLKCGTYKLHGRLGMNNQSQFVLTMQNHTSSPYELIVLGGDPSQKMNFLNSDVSIEAYVYRPLNSNNAPFVLFQKWSPSISQEPVTLLKSEHCGSRDRFVKK